MTPRLAPLLVVLSLLAACPTAPGATDAGPPAPGREDAGLKPPFDAGAPPDGGLPAHGACAVLVARRCDYLARCGLLADGAPGLHACEAWLGDTWCGPSLWSSRVEAAVPTLRYDPLRAQACADAWLTRDCGGWQVEPEPCTRFLLPAAQSHQACYGTWAECVEGVCRGATCPRSCLPRGQLGEVCEVASDCRPGLYCHGTASPGVGTCTAYGTELAPCSVLVPCAQGLACVQGQCAVLPAEGEACPAQRCDETAWCSEDGGVCVSRRNRGAPCSADGQCLAGDLCEDLSHLCAAVQVTQAGTPCGPRQQCPQGTACLGLSPTSTGACLAPGQPGAPCHHPGECSDELTCGLGDGGRWCAPRGRGGAACTTDRDCAALHACLGQVCQALPLPGEPCAPGLRCLYGGCVPDADGGLVCGGLQGPGVACRGPEECASRRCVQDHCLASCAP